MMPVTSGAAKLERFLKTHNVSGAKCARVLGVSKPTVNAWIRCTARPIPVYRDALEKWTQGNVKASDWETAEERRAAKRLEGIQPFAD